MRKLISISMLILICVTAFVPENMASAAPANADPANLLLNGSFEEGNYSSTGSPAYWSKDIFDPSGVLLWDDTERLGGGRSIKITAPTPNDARWIQSVQVEPNTNYRISGWIKTENVGHTAQSEDAGASLGILGTWDQRTVGLFGTHDWTYVSFVFNSREQTQITLAARLGFWSGTATGTAWFDDLEVTPFQATDVHPGWKILALIYDTVDFTYTDTSGVTHHYYGELTQQEKDQIEQEVTRFAEVDIPALNSGNMIPTLTIRYPEQALTQLTGYGEGWSPAPWDVNADLDPAFDSVIVIWDAWVLDDATGETTFVGAAAGLTWWMGTGPAFTAIVSDAATSYGHRNVFKHEWGHSVLFFYEAYGTAPQPAVDNHAFGTPETQYVHCPTGEPYVLIDETPEDPIPNSIYNNESGFTHDYYSGTTATQDEPTRCLGITPETWATGGPVSRPLPSFTPIEKLQWIKNDVNRLVFAGDLAENRARILYDKLDAARAGLREGRDKATVKNLQLFINKVEVLIKTERLSEKAGTILIDQATDLIEQLKG